MYRESPMLVGSYFVEFSFYTEFLSCLFGANLLECLCGPLAKASHHTSTVRVLLLPPSGACSRINSEEFVVKQNKFMAFFVEFQAKCFTEKDRTCMLIYIY